MREERPWRKKVRDAPSPELSLRHLQSRPGQPATGTQNMMTARQKEDSIFEREKAYSIQKELVV